MLTERKAQLQTPLMNTGTNGGEEKKNPQKNKDLLHRAALSGFLASVSRWNKPTVMKRFFFLVLFFPFFLNGADQIAQYTHRGEKSHSYGSRLHRDF